MHRVVIAIVALVGALILGNVALTSVAVPQKGSGKSLPPYWKSLGLTEPQKEKIYKLRGDYRSKIKALSDQIKQLQDEEQKELLKLLTDDQRKTLREILEKKAGVAPNPTADKKDESKEIKEKK